LENFKLPGLINELDELVLKFLRDYRSHNLSNKVLKQEQLRNLSPDDVAGISSSNAIRGFKIGDVVIRNPIISAPLAGISDNTYRIFARFFGAALTFTEMVTSYGIAYRHRKSMSLANITDYERPCVLQIFGSDPVVIAEAAKQVEDRADIIDINMGCPVAKILKSGSGGYLMRDENKIEKILAGLSSVLKKPFTIKTRTGWDRNNINILKVAKIAENRGAAAISVHGRTVKQKFAGEVDYKLIGKVKEKVNIPVIASGDIDSPAKAREVFKNIGCDGIMIGRSAKGRPWFFSEMLLSLTGFDSGQGDTVFLPEIEWKKGLSKLYLKFLVHFKGEYKAVREFRKQLSWIFKGTRGISRARNEFFKIIDFEHAENSIDGI
jgi:tRNA-dihydrouridine synthase B